MERETDRNGERKGGRQVERVREKRTAGSNENSRLDKEHKGKGKHVKTEGEEVVERNEEKRRKEKVCVCVCVSVQ